MISLYQWLLSCKDNDSVSGPRLQPTVCACRHCCTLTWRSLHNNACKKIVPLFMSYCWHFGLRSYGAQFLLGRGFELKTSAWSESLLIGYRPINTVLNPNRNPNTLHGFGVSASPARAFTVNARDTHYSGVEEICWKIRYNKIIFRKRCQHSGVRH